MHINIKQPFKEIQLKQPLFLLFSVILISWGIWGGATQALASGFRSFLKASEEPEAPVPDHFDKLTVLFHLEPGVPFVGFLVAQSEGYYAEEGLPPIEFVHMTPAESGNREMRAGRAQFATIWTARSMLAAAHGDGCVSIAQVLRKSSSGIVVRTDVHPNIRSLSDLASHRVGIFFRGWENATILFHSLGIEIDPIYYQGMGLNLLRQDAAEAICYSSYGSAEVLKCSKYRDHLLFLPFAEAGFDLPEDCLTCTKAFLFKHPDICEKFVRATTRGWAKALSDREKALLAIQKSLESEKDIFDRKIVRAQFEEWKRLIQSQDPAERSILSPEQFDRIFTLLKEAGLIEPENTLSYERYFYPVLLPETRTRIEAEKNAEQNAGGTP